MWALSRAGGYQLKYTDQSLSQYEYAADSQKGTRANTTRAREQSPLNTKFTQKLGKTMYSVYRLWYNIIINK